MKKIGRGRKKNAEEKEKLKRKIAEEEEKKRMKMKDKCGMFFKKCKIFLKNDNAMIWKETNQLHPTTEWSRFDF